MTDTLTANQTSPLTAPQAAAAAATAAAPMAAASREERARWLEAVADALDAAKAELVPIAVAESHLPEARLTGEVGRTTGQLRLFAAVLRDGGYLEVVIDHARPDATPPQPELRRLLVPTGPVAVYAASNFPFAFSVAGGDTASALAAGCPVVVKAHPGHPELSRRTAAIVSAALAEAGAPDGAFGLIEGPRRVGSWSRSRPSPPAPSPDRWAAVALCSTWPTGDRRRSRSTPSWAASTRWW